MSDTLSWLKKLYENSPGYFAVTAFAGGKPRATKWFSTAELDAAAKTVIATGKNADVYVSVATHDTPQERRGGEKSVISIPGLWADLDIGEEGHKPAALPNPPTETDALAIIGNLPEPSLLMHSGGGLQAYWLFDDPWIFNEPIEKNAAKQASKDWQNLLAQRGRELGFHVDIIPSLDRILRVPGTFNHKTGERRPVVARIVQDLTYPIKEIAALGYPEDDPGLVTQDDDKGIHDVFPLTWEEILVPHGISKCNDNLWARPGKSCSEGHSYSTNPNNIPVLVNFSASDELFPVGAGHKLTKFKVWAYLNYGGDFKAAKTAFRKLVKLSADDATKIATRFAETRINWEKLWTEVDPEPDWLIFPIVERGRQVAIYSDAKAGKSLAMQEWCFALATGKDPITKENGLKPINVLYIDKENTKQDIRIRGGKMGYEGENLEHLFYYSFPDLSWLDTEQGGIELYALAKYHDAELVIIDTLSRVVEGEEIDNDTYHAFYKYTGVRLKADGISLVRLDHSGKDATRGMRGASSKTTDVDEVWQLLADDDIVTFTRTHSRTHHGEGRIVFKRVDEPRLCHVLHRENYENQEEEDIITFLDLLRVEPSASRDTAWEAVMSDGTRYCGKGRHPGKLCYSREAVRNAQTKRKVQTR